MRGKLAQPTAATAGRKTNAASSDADTGGAATSGATAASGGGAAPAFSEQALMQLQRIAPCMRQHRVPDFPDPKRAPEGGPSLVGSGYREIDYRGVLLELPITINMQSPAYKQAAATCGAPFLVL
jgi:hypothetical protein